MQDAEIDLRRLFELVRRRIKLISLIAAFSLCLAGISAALLAPVYSATALVLFDPIQKNLLEPDGRSGAGPTDNALVESEVELLRSDTVLRKVVASELWGAGPSSHTPQGLKSRLLAFAGFPPPQLSEDELSAQSVSRFRGAVNVQRKGPTYLIAVSVQAAEPARAALLANAIAQIYIEDQVASKVAAMLASRDVLRARLAQARDEIVQSEASFNDFLRQTTLKMAALPGGANLQNLRRQIDELALERARMDARSQSLASTLANQNWNNLAAALAIDETTLLQQQRLELAAQVASVDTSSPAAETLRLQLLGAEAELTNIAERELASLRTHIAELDTRQANLQDALRTEIMQSDLPADILTGLYDLQGKAVFAREQYQTLLNRSLQMENQSSLQMADSRIASPAIPPSTHTFPNTGLFLGVGAVLGLFLGVAISITYESLIGGFMSQEHLETILRTRVAAVVPRLRLEPGNDTLADLVITAPLSKFAEAMRRTRMAIEQTLGVRALKHRNTGSVVMVTSTAPQEGKSTTAIALARSYALAGQRTLLIDCDLRHPALAQQLDIAPELGLSDMLQGRSGSADLSRMLHRETDTGLSLLLGARGTDGPTDTLLAGPRFERLISSAAEIFDIVVLDTPPIEPVVDALYIAPHADLILLVTRWASTSQRQVRQAMAHLSQAKNSSAKIISLLNGADEPNAGRKQHYRRFYDADYA